jgi:pyruvate kinase
VVKGTELAIGDKVILTHGDLMETVGATNTLKVLTLTKKNFA